jgi:3-oxoacyl-[acyl-carrier-protein] synthase II
MRVVVTGVGVLSPLGATADELWGALVAGRSAIRRIPRLVDAGLTVTTGGEVDALPLAQPRRDVEMSRRPIADALAQARLDPARAGLIWATGLNTTVMEGAVPVERPSGACFSTLAAGFGGPRRMIATACASATQAIGEAFHLVRRGRANVCVAGGATAMLTPYYLIGFSWLQALALDQEGQEPMRACRPFDRGRHGFALSEGGAALVIESLEAARARGVEPLVEIRGFGTSQDAHDLNRPPQGGEGAELCMRRALADAGLGADEIGAVNAHGTGTRAGDPAEATALRRLLGDRWRVTPVSSMKGALGHSMAAAGALQAVAAIRTCQTGIVPPTCNLVEPDEGCELDHVIGGCRLADVAAVLSNSFGMGGQNASVLLSRPC